MGAHRTKLPSGRIRGIDSDFYVPVESFIFCGCAFDVGIGTEDDLGDPLRLEAGQQLTDPELVGPDPLDRIDGPLEDVVAAAELPRLLDRDDVAGLLHDADQGCFAAAVGADGALDGTVSATGGLLGDVVAAVAEGDMLRTQLAILRRLAKHEPFNVIELRQQIAQRVIERGKYTLA